MQTHTCKEQFSVLEDEFVPDVNKILLLLNPENTDHPIYIVRKYLHHQVCEEVKKEFDRQLSISNGGNRHDFVPVKQIGATQFTKSTEEYFNECEKVSSNIQEIVGAITDSNVRKDFIMEETLRCKLKEIGVSFGASSFKNKKVNMFTIRKWTNTNKQRYTLLPHEDRSQLNLARVDNYEIADVKKVVASNLCIANLHGGDIVIWNIDPDISLKEKLGLENTGYPYPIEMMRDIPNVVIKINAGDLFFLNANLVHAIQEVQGAERITLGRFMGYCAENKVVYWT